MSAFLARTLGSGYEPSVIRGERRRTLRSDATPGQTLLSQPKVRIVRTQRQPELRPRREHTIRLANALRRQVVRQNAYVGFGAIEFERDHNRPSSVPR